MIQLNTEVVIHWYRRDLRISDNASLYAALNSGKPVLPIFIFDSNILSHLPERDARVQFIYNELIAIKKQWQDAGSDLQVYYGDPLEIWHKIIAQYNVSSVYVNRDYEPYALERDLTIKTFLNQNGILWNSFRDHVLLEPGEILKSDGSPYTVFTPFSKKWRSVWLGLEPEFRNQSKEFFPSEELLHNGAKFKSDQMPTLMSMGFQNIVIEYPDKNVQKDIISNYSQNRDFPAMSGTSRLGVHLRFGTISIRALARFAFELNQTYINELIWRDFYQHILYHFPFVVQRSFRSEYDRIEWRNNPNEFEAWCQGLTGYPLVDAGMRELNETGYMHNRVRMVVASFLTKHLLIDWRWGEAYFAEKLLDFELASNNGGWQWAAGCGTDAAPYFRIFNPESQLVKFDKNMLYVKRWVPEVFSLTYPRPIVNHVEARIRCLETYKKALKGN
jgi:deoxyribodipyrimidine photo-lyase